MSNPNRGRGGFFNGRGRPPSNQTPAPQQTSVPEINGELQPVQPNGVDVSPRGSVRGIGVRGSFPPRARGRGFVPNFDRGRGRGFRGRGRGIVAAPVSS